MLYLRLSPALMQAESVIGKSERQKKGFKKAKNIIYAFLKSKTWLKKSMVWYTLNIGALTGNLEFDYLEVCRKHGVKPYSILKVTIYN